MFRESPTAYLIIPGQEPESIDPLINQILTEHGVELLTLDTASFRSAAYGDVTDAIKRADMVIADISGLQPNALFELGIAYGARKPILALSRDLKELPSSMSGLNVLTYRPHDTEKLVWYLHDWVREQGERVMKLSQSQA